MKKRPGLAHLKIFFMHTQKHFQPIYKVQRAQVADLIQKEAPVATMSAMRGPLMPLGPMTFVYLYLGTLHNCHFHFQLTFKNVFNQ